MDHVWEAGIFVFSYTSAKPRSDSLEQRAEVGGGDLGLSRKLQKEWTVQLNMSKGLSQCLERIQWQGGRSDVF